jgi:glycerophosphoryl diester phosphodiesterase
MSLLHKVLFTLITLLPTMSLAQKIDIQGHRGARGMMPENSIPAFIYALEQGVTTLELDVVITKDRQVLVSHEPYFNPEICLGPDGKSLKNLDKEALNIYQLTYEEIQRYDCGSLANDRFPEQQKLYVNKPLLSDVIRQVERYTKSHSGFEVAYNIELKSSPEGDGSFHPSPEEFSKLVYQTIDDYLPWDRVIIQSFDFRILQYWNKNYPDVTLAALVENIRSIDTNLGALGFVPDIYSPAFELLSEKNVKELHDKKIRVIPWTVNNEKDMERLVAWGVDGIITDYPNKANALGLTRKKQK